MDVIDKLISLALEKGWSQAKLEKRAGLAQGRLSKWKDDIGKPYWHQVVACAKALDVPLGRLVDGDPAAEMTEDDRFILRLARSVGFEEAGRRLAVSPERVGPPQMAPLPSPELRPPTRPARKGRDVV
jgi:transcriptional regulator with XRE-family HTH domain